MVRPYNSGHAIAGDAAQGGPIADPMATAAHDSEFNAIFDSSEFCAGCHDVIETSGLNLERPYAEWLESPAPALGKNCQSCHMPTYTGKAAESGPERHGLHNHRFVGVELPHVEELADPDLYAELDAEIDTLLRTAASIQIAVPSEIAPGSQLDLVLTVENLIDGHAFPTGSTMLRQVWVEVVVTDAAGDMIYETGTLDSKGDLRNVWSTVDPFGDQDLLLLSSSLIGPGGQPEVFPWRATEHRSGAISPAHERTYTLFVPVPPDAEGELQIDAAIHFRTYPPFLIDVLGLTDQVPAEILKVRDVAEASATVDVVAPGD